MKKRSSSPDGKGNSAAEQTRQKRRDFLKKVGLSSFIITPLPDSLIALGDSLLLTTATANDEISIELLRPDDLLVLQLRYLNCKFVRRGQQTFVVPDKPKKAMFMVAEFPSQHTLEQAFPADQDNIGLPARFIRGGSSRLVYRIPQDFQGIPLITEAVLDWRSYTLVVNPRARFVTVKSQAVKALPSKNVSRKVTIKGKKILQNYLPQDPDAGKVAAPNRAYNLALNPKYITIQAPGEEDLNLQGLPDQNKKLILKAVDLRKYKIEPPSRYETAIEAPARLIISPNQLTDFIHTIRLKPRAAPSSGGNINNLQSKDNAPGEIVELWHTRMGVKLQNGQISEQALPHLKSIRALWSTDYQNPQFDFPFLASLDSRERMLLVHHTSDFRIKGFTPRAVKATQLYLSALGSWLDLNGNFDYPDREKTEFPLLKWEHRSTMGRDHYVKIAEAGFLYPLGHKASLVKVTERKFDDTRTALNRKRFFIVVQEPQRFYSSRDKSDQFIPFPFQAVRINTLVTPNLDTPDNVMNLGSEPRRGDVKPGEQTNIPIYNFWIEVQGSSFLFNLEATDKEGRTLDMDLPLMFVGEGAARSAQHVQQLNDHYNQQQSRNRIAMNGQVVAYADSLLADDTSFVTDQIHFAAIQFADDPRLRFYPSIHTAKVYVKAVEELTGDPNAVEISLYDDQNPAGTFAQIVSPKMVDFNGNADKSGGMVNPNTSAQALSKLQGVIGGDIDQMSNLDFDPQSFFNDNISLGGAAKLFGVIPLFELLLGGIDIKAESEQLTNELGDLSSQLDVLKTELEGYKEELESATGEAQKAVQAQIDSLKEQIDGVRDQLQSTLDQALPKVPGLKLYKTDTAAVVEYQWYPEMEQQKSFFGVLDFTFKGDTSKAMEIGTKLVRPFDTSLSSQLSISSRINLFSVAIADMIGVNFEYMSFKAGGGEKTSVKVILDQDEAIVFMGPLAFINNLQNIIPGDGFGEGPYINLQPTGVKAGFELGIPDVQVGILSITNMTLGAYARLPFTGAPLTIGFSFCRRESPFLLTVSCFGGGGFVAIETSVKGFVMMEAAFEFGAAISFSVAVASGGVSVMAGFYFKLEVIDQETSVVLTGYFRLNGELSILGLITLAMEIYLALTYIVENGKAGKLYGEASVKLMIEVLFFSKSVSFTVRRTLKGADADPKFAEMIAPDHWEDYCLAFAS